MTNEGNIRSFEKNVFVFPLNYLNAINNRDIFKTQLDSKKQIKCHPTCKTCGNKSNPTTNKDCITCTNKKYKLSAFYKDGTGSCVL